MIRNVLVTSGGTSEPIDAILSITANNTGRLGSLIADAFAESQNVENIFYIHGKGAVLPSSEKVTPIGIETVNDLLIAIQDLYKNRTIDAVVHAMTVSNYRVKSVVSVDEALKRAKYTQDKAGFAASMTVADISGGENRLSSEIEAPLLFLEHTPKILPLFRKMSPGSLVVGFKLLSGSTNDGLINTAYRLLLTSGCDYVFANDCSDLSDGEHKGYLINSGRFVFPYSGNEDIAKGIAATVLGRDGQ